MSVDTETAPTERRLDRTVRTGVLARLFALVVVAMLPALALQAYNEIAGRQEREIEVREDAMRLALFTSGEVDRIIENAHTVPPPSPTCRR